jgi:hypothetical protein
MSESAARYETDNHVRYVTVGSGKMRYRNPAKTSATCCLLNRGIRPSCSREFYFGFLAKIHATDSSKEKGNAIISGGGMDIVRSPTLVSTPNRKKDLLFDGQAHVVRERHIETTEWDVVSDTLRYLHH